MASQLLLCSPSLRALRLPLLLQAVRQTHSSSASAAGAASAASGLMSVTHDVDQATGCKTGVYIVRFNSPSNLNAFSVAMGEAFEKTMESLCVDDALRAVVLTGAGRAFSGGGDLTFLLDRAKESSMSNVYTMKAFYKRFLSVRKVPVPVIAAINGPAVGAGFCVALACDIRLAAHDATMGANFVKLGITPGMAGTHILPAVTSPQVAARLCMTGDLIKADEAKSLGIVLSVEPADKLVGNAVDLARRIARNSPKAMRRLVQMQRSSVDEGLERALWQEADAQALCYNEPDLLEGVAAVKEKRPAVFEDFRTGGLKRH